MKVIDFLEAVEAEVGRARVKHAPINSLHEGYSVILEEVDELWDETRKKREARNPEDVRRELIQIAAMACRTALDLEF